ncbi:receptor-like serine/threonine-protein kinase SD1-8 [Ziziphus jujuba]|uniref:Receptor-like serine/threonine-protein kinase n=1 Tax=Ziziphus jujuba TaxID=326968 RepID=A0A6P3Z363_ZIZJJ|nr:receptor-like serine/threonine-protein kinase SD1-8 [Ziziphus jujuba]
MKTSKVFLHFHIFFCFLCSSHALEKLTPGMTLQGYETLISAGGMFELGFFTEHKLRFQYLGIWFKNDRNRKPVWVANRGTPLLDFTGVLSIRYDGNLVMTDVTTIPNIVNNGELAKSNETSAEILDSGNLILLESGKIIWQSFDYPTDTLLAGMKLGWFNINTNSLRLQYLSSWLSPSDPNTGFYYLGLNTNDTSRFNLWRLDSAYQQIGLWDGYEFRFFFQSSSDNHYNFSYVSNSKNISLTFHNIENEGITWFVLDSDGSIIEFRMEGEEISSVNYSVCDAKMPHNSTGCLILSPTMCKDGDDFSYNRGLIPTSMLVSLPAITSPSECDLICRSNCSCVGYVSMNDNGTGCQIFYGEKADLLNSIGLGNDAIYMRGDASKSDHHRKRKLLLMIVIILLLPLLLILLIKFSYGVSRYFHYSGNNERSPGSMREFQTTLTSQLSTNKDYSGADIIEFSTKKDHELPLLSFSSVVAATDNFSTLNKIGQGGFGPVYKGKLQGHDIAVKRLSKYSGQGLVEFKNEVELISKLQHRNLVKLLACCIEGEEKILIYEYLPNKSLDSFIFDAEKRTLLDWRKRKHIIDGIAQGLLYLHKYSRLRIIHRDLKTSNILLDDCMNPKISDFGMAKILFESEFRTKTHRVVGTYGYMSPEYAVHGFYSIKSDVFSFGVILLEIVSGRKNATFDEPNSSLNLLGYAWDSWNGGRCMELIDPTMDALCSVDDTMLYIQVGLLCVQESAEDRPTMSDVVSMFSNERTSLPTPKQPAYSTLLKAADSSISRRQTPSQNLVTISVVEAR